MDAFLGIDVGTSSSKGVAVDDHGVVLASCRVPHGVSRRYVGWAEHDANGVWWHDFVRIARELVQRVGHQKICAIAVSGIGPCVLPASRDGGPLRPALLYGIDSRAKTEIEEVAAELGVGEIIRVCGSALTTQAVGPKLRWLSKYEPEVAARTSLLFSCSSYLVFRLTREYIIDHTSASHFLPLYSLIESQWEARWMHRMGVDFDPPPLAWPGEVVGTVTRCAAEETGLPEGLMVTAGTIDSCAEAFSVGVHSPGDMMFMYGSTLVMLAGIAGDVAINGLAPINGLFPGSRFLVGSVTAAGALVDWIAGVVGGDVARLADDAALVPPGSRGLLVMPYLFGEHTPFSDPAARGAIFGLRGDHARGDIFRACLEGVAFAARQNLDLFPTHDSPSPAFAVGGGVRLKPWVQILSDVTGIPQALRKLSIGACFGNAMFAAEAAGVTVDIDRWNPVDTLITPDVSAQEIYATRYPLLQEFYLSTNALTRKL